MRAFVGHSQRHPAAHIAQRNANQTRCGPGKVFRKTQHTQADPRHSSGLFVPVVCSTLHSKAWGPQKEGARARPIEDAERRKAGRPGRDPAFCRLLGHVSHYAQANRGHSKEQRCNAARLREGTNGSLDETSLAGLQTTNQSLRARKEHRKKAKKDGHRYTEQKESKRRAQAAQAAQATTLTPRLPSCR